MTREQLRKFLEINRVCDPATDWFDRTPGTPEELWFSCPFSSWLLWVLRETVYILQDDEAAETYRNARARANDAFFNVHRITTTAKCDASMIRAIHKTTPWCTVAKLLERVNDKQ